MTPVPLPLSGARVWVEDGLLHTVGMTGAGGSMCVAAAARIIAGGTCLCESMYGKRRSLSLIELDSSSSSIESNTSNKSSVALVGPVVLGAGAAGYAAPEPEEGSKRPVTRVALASRSSILRSASAHASSYRWLASFLLLRTRLPPYAR